jgi:hypothetical protein
LAGGEPASWLPRYDLDIRLDTSLRVGQVTERVTWTNTSTEPVAELVFNAHAHYTIPDGDIGKLAKILELLRMSPHEAMSFDGPALEVEQVRLSGEWRARGGEERKKGRTGAGETWRSQTLPDSPAPALPLSSPPPATRPQPPIELPFHYQDGTALVVSLPEAVEPGASVTVELRLALKIPPKKGRWGQWEGVTTLAQWLPVVAVYDHGWKPAPFIPWHQPFYNEAGFYTAQVTLPADQKLACSGMIQKTEPAEDGWVRHTIAPICLRDFALIASARFEEHTGEADGTHIRVLALPEHDFYARKIVDTVCQALPVYNRWFGRYPYPQFTVAEAYFGWNGNECGSLVMIDYRMFGMPHIAHAYIDSLVSHELCHQWWYGVVGTNGYAETWMDEGLATYFTHRLVTAKVGRDNKLLDYPKYLEWLPNIAREDFRNYSYLGVRARGQIFPTVQEMPQFGHLANLSAYAYDRGSKIVGMIEERMGEEAFLDFMRGIYGKYQYRILRVADFQRELEAFTGRPWDDFFQHWLYSAGMCDWSVQEVRVEGRKAFKLPASIHSHAEKLRAGRDQGVRTVVTLRQHGGINEPTVLGFRLPVPSHGDRAGVARTREGGDDGGYQVRIPIMPDVPFLELEEFGAKVECLARDNSECTVRVEVLLPCAPTQVTVDPDHILLDSNPTNNHWKPEVRWRFTPLYTQLEETDVTNSYDRWNVIVGPWVYGAAYNDPWYTRSPLAGVKASVYRTQELDAGAFVAYRSNDRNVVAGVDALWDHVPLPNTQVGLTVEKSLFTLGTDAPCSRGVLFGRYILLPSSSLYLPAFEYVETFGVVQNRCLPDPATPVPGADPFNERPGVGIHYHKNYMTPYWDAEGGFAIDATYQYGLPIFGNNVSFNQVYGQAALVKSMPKLEALGDGPILTWLRQTRWAFRLGGAAALPLNGEFFALGGGDQFRGFDQAQRQGSITWVGSVEWRVPIFTNLSLDLCDHVAGVRNVYLAPFYDVGDAYVNGHSLGPTAHALGAGLRVDVAWLGLIERTILRLDIAKAIGGSTPVQVWFGVQHPF